MAACYGKQINEVDNMNGIQKDLEGKAIKGWSTEEYDTKATSAGSLTIEGVNFIPDELKDAVGPYGPLKIVIGHKASGEEFQLMTSSNKLMKMLVAHWDEIVGTEVNISGIGSEFARQYSIRPV
jgi:hypothetical protein